MTFYTYEYKIDQELEIVFKYFLRKDYLIMYFDDKDWGTVEVKSGNNSKYLEESDEVSLNAEDKNSIIQLLVKDIKIVKNHKISMRLLPGEFVDKAEDNNGDSDGYTEFMGKLFGHGMLYEMDFMVKEGRVIVKERSSIDEQNFFKKIIWKMLGWYYGFKQRKTHEIVKMEIEAINK